MKVLSQYIRSIASKFYRIQNMIQEVYNLGWSHSWLDLSKSPCNVTIGYSASAVMLHMRHAMISSSRLSSGPRTMRKQTIKRVDHSWHTIKP